jgi:hypothetical protein
MQNKRNSEMSKKKKHQATFKETLIRLTADFSAEIRRECNEIFQVLKE